MQKRHKVLIAVVAFVGIVYGVFFVKPALELKQLEKLTPEDSPTAKCLAKMPDTEEIYGWVKELTDMGARIPGTDAGRLAQAYVLQNFTDFGIEDAEVVESISTNWRCNDWRLTVSGREIPSYFMAHSLSSGKYGDFSTPAGGLNAEIVYVGEGKEADFKKVDVKGKIVVSDVIMNDVPVGLAKFVSYLFYDPDKTLPITSSRRNPYETSNYPYNYFHAMENGAVGFIGVLSNYIDSNAYNNENLAYLGGDDNTMKIPALWVNKTDGADLVQTNKSAGGAVEANLQMEVQIKEVEAGAVVGLLPGQSDEIIMIQTHYDSSTTGATEDASGTAVVMALAKFFAQIPYEERERSLLFVAMDTHFTDYNSHDAFIEKYLGEDHKILADVCIEHIAYEAEEVDGEIVLTGELEPRIIFASKIDALLDITKEEIVRHNYKRTIILPADMFGEEVPTDSDLFYQVGVPIISLVSGPIYLYDNQDTIDKVPKEELRATAESFADIVWRLMKLPSQDFSK